MLSPAFKLSGSDPSAEALRALQWEAASSSSPVIDVATQPVHLYQASHLIQPMPPPQRIALVKQRLAQDVIAAVKGDEDMKFYNPSGHELLVSPRNPYLSDVGKAACDVFEEMVQQNDLTGGIESLHKVVRKLRVTIERYWGDIAHANDTDSHFLQDTMHGILAVASSLVINALKSLHSIPSRSSHDYPGFGHTTDVLPSGNHDSGTGYDTDDTVPLTQQPTRSNYFGSGVVGGLFPGDEYDDAAAMDLLAGAING